MISDLITRIAVSLCQLWLLNMYCKCLESFIIWWVRVGTGGNLGPLALYFCKMPICLNSLGWSWIYAVVTFCVFLPEVSSPKQHHQPSYTNQNTTRKTRNGSTSNCCCKILFWNQRKKWRISVILHISCSLGCVTVACSKNYSKKQSSYLF